jgi:hypothetical protein
MTLKYGAVAMLFLAGLAALFPQSMAWPYIGAFIAFELWLLRRMKTGVGSGPVPVGEPPYLFSAHEAELAARYRFYFTYPAIARDAASTLAAIGLAALVLSPWLLFRQQLMPAFFVALNLVAVGMLTRRLSPVMVLTLAANKGDRTSLDLLSAHDSAWAKIKDANARGA